MSTAKGGGKSKTESHYALCVALFEKSKVYGKAFKLATTPKQQGVWAEKIKNKIRQ